MMKLSQAAHAISARQIGADVEFTAVSIDSRALQNGALFVAIKGDRFDGHDFIDAAITSGAVALMVEREIENCLLPQIVVADCAIALGQLAQYWRRRCDPLLVALTGSNGKTTVKEMLAGILRTVAGEHAVLATRGNLNNHLGVPLTLLELRKAHRYAVVEMGMNHAGEIDYLTRMAEPDVALITNAGVAHIENLGTPIAIARAKGEIFNGLKSDGQAVINADDAHASLWRELSVGKRQLEFALDVPAAVTATYKLRPFDSEIVLKTPRGSASAVIVVPGLHNVRNAVAAGAAATALEISPEHVARGLSEFAGVKGRLQRKVSASGATLIDDTYNANPDSVRAAIATLMQTSGEKVLVLGDMGELGAHGTAMHSEIGEYARQAGVQRLFTLGEAAALATQSFGAGAVHAQRIEDLLSDLERVLAPGMTVLVKGSRFMRMERVVAGLQPHTAQASGQEHA